MPFAHFFKKKDNNLSYYAWFSAMHSRADFLFTGGESEAQLNELTERAVQLIADIEATANCYNEQSELSKLVRTAVKAPTHVSTMLYELLMKGKAYHAMTSGFYDITFASTPHDAQTIDDIVLGEPDEVSLARTGVYINMCGMLKGYALDKIGELVRSYSIENALLSFGNSSIMAIGHREGCDGWPIRLPQAAQSNELTLHDECLSTSGNDSNDRKHIVNPLTGRLIEGRNTLSLITHDAALGDALSTACFACSTSQAKAIAQKAVARIIESNS